MKYNVRERYTSGITVQVLDDEAACLSSVADAVNDYFLRHMLISHAIYLKCFRSCRDLLLPPVPSAPHPPPHNFTLL